MKFVRRSATGLYVPAAEPAVAYPQSFLTDVVCSWGGSGDRTGPPWLVDVSGGDPFATTGIITGNQSGPRLAPFTNANSLGDQFSRITYDGSSLQYQIVGNVVKPCGGAVCVRYAGITGSETGFYFVVFPTGAEGSITWNWSYGLFSSSAGTTSLSSFGGGTFAGEPAGSIFQLEATGTLATTPIVVSCCQNGSQLGAHNYSPSGTSYDAGKPGACSSGGGSDGTQTTLSFSNWKGGPLTLTIPSAPTHRRGSGYYIDQSAKSISFAC